MTNLDKEPKIMPNWKKAFVSRQDFLKVTCLACSGIIGLTMAIPGIAFALNYLFSRRRSAWVQLGPVDEFKEGETVSVVFEEPERLPWDGVTAKRSAWLRRASTDTFIAFAINCTHLGCPVRWEAGANLFLCPCHGGVYYANGDVAGGPPPRPMHRYPVRINRGQVEIAVSPVLLEG